MHIKAVLFDLDGTLLPIDQDAFLKAYFSELGKVLCPMGITPKKLVEAVWAGTGDMVQNDGSRLNEDAFWSRFLDMTGFDTEVVRPMCDSFYVNEFNNVRAITEGNPLAKKAVEMAGRSGRKVVLATNPLFPLAGQLTRLGWIGLGERDFDLITSYESERCSKPNPKYYLAICDRIGIAPQNCLMVGNDELEDMYSASSVGMNCYHVTDFGIYSEKHPWEGEKGSFSELLEFLEKL